jgi:hypothetical protein
MDPFQGYGIFSLIQQEIHQTVGLQTVSAQEAEADFSSLEIFAPNEISY